MSVRARRMPRRARRALPLVATGLLCLVATGCTGGSADEPRASASASASSSAVSPEPVTLRFSVYGGPEVRKAYRQLAVDYHLDHPEVTVEVEASGDVVTARDRLHRHFAAQDPPDLFLADQTDLAGLVAGDRVQPVDELLEKRGVQFGDNYQRLGLEAFAADSALQCMPNEVSPYVVFYNKRLLVPRNLVGPEDEPPTPEKGWKWEQFELAARQMSTNGVRGLYLPPRLSTLMPLMRSAGADIVDDPRKPTTLTLADDANREALEQVLTLARDPNLTPTARQLSKEDALTRFENGSLGMLVGTRDLVPRLRQNPDLHFDVYPLPSLGQARTVADVTGYCLSKDTAHVEQAADFLAYAAGPKGSETMAASGGVVPANLAALHSAQFLEPTQFPRQGAVFDEVMRRADSLPSVAGWPSVVTQTQPYVDRLFTAPVLDLDTLLPKVDQVSAEILAAAASPSASPSPSAGD